MCIDFSRLGLRLRLDRCTYLRNHCAFGPATPSLIPHLLEWPIRFGNRSRTAERSPASADPDPCRRPHGVRSPVRATPADVGGGSAAPQAETVRVRMSGAPQSVEAFATALSMCLAERVVRVRCSLDTIGAPLACRCSETEPDPSRGRLAVPAATRGPWSAPGYTQGGFLVSARKCI